MRKINFRKKCVLFFLLQGWFDLASARHSMGTLRITSTLLDLKDHSAASTLQVSDQDGKVWFQIKFFHTQGLVVQCLCSSL